MAPQIFNRRFLYCTLIASLFSVVSFAQNSKTQPHKTYVVIGAYTVEKNASRLVELVKEFDMEATIRNNEHRGLYYVYIDQSMNRSEMVQKVKNLRTQYTQFYDAWAYTGDFTDKPAPQKGLESTNKLESVAPKKDENLVEKEMATGKSEIKPSGSDTLSTSSPNMAAKTEETTKVEEPDEPAFEKKEDHFYFYFNTINTKNFKEVNGKINIIDPERAKQLKIAKSHELVELEDPNNGTRRVKVATDIFGFREVQYTLDLDSIEALQSHPSVEVIGDSIVVNFDLQRFKKGDVLVMYNVYFYKDAAIMKSESIYELNSLLDMLKENQNLTVKIHGHTNGNSHGKIVHLNLDDKNFFGINGEHNESNGSAKKLSLYRAYTIQHWLIEQGISEERMEIKGWGGKKMIYDKHDSQANKNVRVEIEILEE